MPLIHGIDIMFIQQSLGIRRKSFNQPQAYSTNPFNFFYGNTMFFLQNNVTIVTTQGSYLIISCLRVTIEAFSIVT